jgi:hypothetical protein
MTAAAAATATAAATAAAATAALHLSAPLCGLNWGAERCKAANGWGWGRS